MVFTRSQKRNVEESDLQVNDGFANVNLIKKKKIIKHGDGSEQNNNNDKNNNYITYIICEDNETNESEYLPNENLDSETYTDTEYSNENTESNESNELNEINQFNEIDQLNDIDKVLIDKIRNKKKELNENSQKILNIKLNQSQIQEIIQESIKQLIKRYDDNDMEFIREKSNKNNNENDYNNFLDIIDSIYSGDFFQRIPIEDKIKKLKDSITKEEIGNLTEELEKIKDAYKSNAPSIIDILKMNVPLEQKQKLLEKVYLYSNSEILTNEYNNSLKHLMLNINNKLEPHLVELEQKILNVVDSDKYTDNYKHKILKSHMSFENKVIAYKKLEIMQMYEDNDNTEYAKYKNWLDGLLSVPFDNYIKTPSINEMDNKELNVYIQNVRKVLDKRLSFMEKPKDQIINLITQMIRNPDFPLNAIGIYGPRGQGKTSLIKSIAEALNRPYRTISLGGESDSSVLNGHGFTYVGSNPGRIIEILKETQTMNPVILIDEIDKISSTHQGQEIIGSLIHLTDYTTNNKYNYDRYYSGIDFDISKALFVFTYNDPTKIDKILSDRLYKIKVDNYNVQQKLEITKKHIIPNVLENYKFTNNEVNFENDSISYIVNISKSADGMREIKRNIEVIISRINTLLLTKNSENIIKLKYKSLHENFKNLPVLIKKEHIDILLAESISSDNISSEPPLGMYI
jgi:ATP-dependent Lon protease